MIPFSAMKKLAIIITHPIQYYAPVFKLLTMRSVVQLKVFYTWGASSLVKYDPGFNRVIEWDIPLLDGYEYEFLENTSKNPGTQYFKGIINPFAIKQIEKFAPDAILVYGWNYESHLKIINYFKKKIKVYFRGDSHLLDTTSFWKAAVKNISLHFLYKKVDKAFYVGQANRLYFKKYGLKDNQLVFAPHAIDNARFSKCREEEAAGLRKDLMINEDDILILFAGKLEPKKDPRVLLASFEKINRPDLHLLIVGNGEMENELKQEVSSYKTVSRIHFMEFQNQSYMPVLYQACDLFCLPSRGPGETWGLAVNEAMASNKAVIASDKVGCSADLIKDGINGKVFKSGNIESLVQALVNTTISRHYLKEMGKASGKMIKNWSIEQQVTSIEKELQL